MKKRNEYEIRFWDTERAYIDLSELATKTGLKRCDWLRMALRAALQAPSEVFRLATNNALRK